MIYQLYDIFSVISVMDWIVFTQIKKLYQKDLPIIPFLKKSNLI